MNTCLCETNSGDMILCCTHPHIRTFNWWGNWYSGFRIWVPEGDIALGRRSTVGSSKRVGKLGVQKVRLWHNFGSGLFFVEKGTQTPGTPAIRQGMFCVFCFQDCVHLRHDDGQRVSFTKRMKKSSAFVNVKCMARTAQRRANSELPTADQGPLSWPVRCSCCVAFAFGTQNVF